MYRRITNQTIHIMKKTASLLIALAAMACLGLSSCADKTCNCKNYVAGFESGQVEEKLGDHDNCSELTELTITDPEMKTGKVCE